MLSKVYRRQFDEFIITQYCVVCVQGKLGGRCSRKLRGKLREDEGRQVQVYCGKLREVEAGKLTLKLGG